MPAAILDRLSWNLRLFAPWLLFVVLANLPFWFASHAFGLLSKGIFNVEFLLVGIVSLFVPRWIAALLLFAATALDLLSGIAVTYLFTASEALRSIRWTSEIAPQHGADLAILGFLILLSVLFAVIAPPPSAKARVHTAIAFAVLFIVCVGLDLGTGHASSFWHTDRQLGTIRLSRTPLHSLNVIDTQQARIEGAGRRLPFADSRIPSASSISLPSTGSTKQPDSSPNIVLILAESWGQPEDPKLDQALLQPFNDAALRERYTVRKGTVPFSGATIDGAARELCGSLHGFSLIDASASDLANCLPARLERLGYRTIGVHGFTGRMYDRRAWWQTIGFEERWFKEQLKGSGLPVCPGPFPGICDAALAQWIGGRLEQPSNQPTFLYWVTLNSHLPVPIPNRVEHPASCSPLPATAQSPPLCSWFQLIVDTQRSVAALALRPSPRPSIFLVVGDHQPAFSTPALRGQFSDKVVPYVLLLPRVETTPARRPAPFAMLAQHRPQTSARRARSKAVRSAHVGG